MTKDGESAEIVESAKAVQETAKATGKAIDASRDLGAFVARFIGGPLEQASLIVEDKLRYMRWERQVRFMGRAQELLEDVGLSEPTRAVPMKVAIPLLQAASLEEDDDLQDIWARLLVNAANADSGVDVHRMFITILEDFGQLEAVLLQAVYGAPAEIAEEGIPTARLPTSYIDLPAGSEPELPSESVQLAIWNLIRLGCLASVQLWDGPTIGKVNITTLGTRLIEACTLKSRD